MTTVRASPVLSALAIMRRRQTKAYLNFVTYKHALEQRVFSASDKVRSLTVPTKLWRGPFRHPSTLNTRSPGNRRQCNAKGRTMKERTQEWWIEVSIRRAFRDWIERQEGVECKPEPASKAFQARAEKRYRLWLEQERERDQFERSQ